MGNMESLCKYLIMFSSRNLKVDISRRSLSVLYFSESYVLMFQTTEPIPDDDEEFELPEDIQPFLQDTPLYSDNTANGLFHFLFYCLQWFSKMEVPVGSIATITISSLLALY